MGEAKDTKKTAVIADLASPAAQPGVKMRPPPPDLREVLADHIASLHEKIVALEARVTALEAK